MSVKVMNAVWQGSRASARGVLLLLAVADCADDNGEAWPDAKTLAKKARTPVSTTYKHLLGLEELGELEVEREGNVIRGYRVRLENLSHFEKGSGVGRLIGASGFLTSEDPSLRNITESSLNNKRVCYDLVTGFLVPPDILARWLSAYPACNLQVELAKAHDWVASRWPKSRRKDWTKFMSGWLSRSQERGGTKNAQTGGDQRTPSERAESKAGGIFGDKRDVQPNRTLP